MHPNPHTPRVNAFEELWATNKPIPYERPLPAYYYESVSPAQLRNEVQQMQTDEEPNLDFDSCPDCGLICSCVREE